MHKREEEEEGQQGASGIAQARTVSGELLPA